MGLIDWIKQKLKTPTYSQKSTIQNNCENQESLFKIEFSIDRSIPEINKIYTKKLDIGLLPGEIVLLDWINGKEADSSFPQYFRYDYGIDAETSMKKLVYEDYLRLSTPMESLKYMKVDSLKQILRDNSLKVSGNKQELIDRIIANFTESELDNFSKMRTRRYILTNKGKEVFNTYYYIIPAHRYSSKDGIYNVATAIDFVSKHNNYPTNHEIAWSLFTEAEENNRVSHKYGLFRNVKLHKAVHLQRQNNIEHALNHCLEVFIIDLSGLGNGLYLNSPSLINSAPAIKSYINSYIETLDMNEEILKKKFSKVWDSLTPQLPFHLLDKNSCLNCLLAFLNDNEEYIEKEIESTFDRIDKKTFTKKYNLRLPHNLD
ncbi:SAP domain-containing protein [Halalkalibacterium halodurans]|uniref:SAP domain-containing protein n=1 Tax=Halalkalibacterium halodurans TaxID=86665 RepID=A0A0M0KNG1_ALKHA|nr:SAP domain-containing protein [Halalkalibacterium halodurans]